MIMVFALVLGAVNVYHVTDAKAEETVSPKPQATAVRHRNIKRTGVNAGKGDFRRTITLSVPRLSRGSHSDSVSWSFKKLNSTGEGRKRYGQASVTLNQHGNSVDVVLDNLLDLEDYSVIVSYSQTYYWDETFYETRTDSQTNKTYTVSYTRVMSAHTSGEKTGSCSTPADTYVRDADDLEEKVHKYNSLQLAQDIDCGSGQSIVDGKGRYDWKKSGSVSDVFIEGSGREIRRSGEGALFHVNNGAGLSLSDVYVRAYSGTITSTPTDGGEYITENASGGATGVGVLVGYDPAFDLGHAASYGSLSVNNSEIIGGRSAVVFRYGAADISASTLYGMGAANVFDAVGAQEYLGTGLGLINSSINISGAANKVSVSSDTSIYGRFNGVIIQGNPSLDITGCSVRADCEDAFDFRGSGSLNISGCSISGVKGIDNFQDAVFQGIHDALNVSGMTFDSSQYRKKVLKDEWHSGGKASEIKGTVSVSDTSFDIITGPFSQTAQTTGVGIQNHGNLSIGKGVSIKVRHSEVWSSAPEGSRADAVGISNVRMLDLPQDIDIESDGIGIECSREIGTVRAALKAYNKMSSDETAIVERQITAEEKIFDDIDDGHHSSLTVHGGSIKARDTGIASYYGNLEIHSDSKTSISGEHTGISVGKNDKDNIFGDDAIRFSFRVNGEGDTDIRSSLHGNGIVIRRSTNGELYSDIDISGTDSRCGSGIVNYGFTLLKNAVIDAEECGIRNAEGGTLYMGDDLEEDSNSIEISGAVYGLYNSGTVIYYRHVDITESKKAAVMQDGLFYMLAGAEVSPDPHGHNVIYLNEGRTVRLFYDDYEKELIDDTMGTFLLAEDDRKPGRVMVELYSPWATGGGVNYSDESYDGLTSEEKKEITDHMTGFDLAFDKIDDRPAALRSGLGKYEEQDTNGKTGTLILSCLLEADYQADLPVKNDHITSKDPEKTEYYWREPTEFTVASDLYETDRSIIFYDGRDVTAGLRQMGWRDKEKDGQYGDEIYSDKRITRIYGDCHTFCGVWDSRFTLLFDGNGQTNGAENYTESGVAMDYTVPGNTGPGRKELDYFRKSVKKNDSLHPVAFEGWSLDHKAIYKDSGVYREGDKIEDTIGFYVDALENGEVIIKDDEAVVRIYVVWDEYPVITAFDSYFYAKELTDSDKIRNRLLSSDKVSATDLCDGDIPLEKIEVYTDPQGTVFDVDAMKGLGDLGSINVYYKASDNNGHTSVATAQVHIMTEESEDTSDDLPEGGNRGESGTSRDTMYSSPVYVRNIDEGHKNSLIENSVWREQEYEQALNEAFDETKTIEKWKFTDSDIEATKKLLYTDKAGASAWRKRFLANRVSDSRIGKEDKNKPLIAEEGLSSLRLVWDLKSETDRIDLTVISPDGTSVPVPPVERKEGSRMPSSVIIDSLEPGADYDIAADLYYKGKYIRTLSQTAHSAMLEKPQVELASEDTGKQLNVKLSVRTDEYADSYIVERRKVTGEKSDWTKIHDIGNTGDDMLTFTETITDEGVYRYRVKSIGHRIGQTESTEMSEYSDEMETAFVYQPVIAKATKGCRSIGIDFEKDSDADYIRVYYQAEGGSRMHTDYTENKSSVVISDERLSDGTEYELQAAGYITSPESKITYRSLVSQVKKAKTHKLKAPKIKQKSQKAIYSAEGNTIRYVTEPLAEGYRISIKKIYRDSEKMTTTDIDPDGEYIHKPGVTGIYTYVVKADFKTLDGKDFHIDSNEVTAAYIRPQAAVSETVEAGSSKIIGLMADDGADGYLVIVRKVDGSNKKIYVPEDDTKVKIRAAGDKMTVVERRAVLFYNGREYRGACI